jgi:hypothetical protein
MISSPENPDRQINRMAGCATMGLWVWKWVVRLLVTWALIYLATVLYSIDWGYWGRHPASETMHAKTMLRDLQVVLRHFKTEYSKLPIDPDESKIIRSDGILLRSLIDTTATTNPKGLLFLVDWPTARPGIPGLKSETSSLSNATLVDPWGERYYLLLESTGDNRIPNPERLPGATGKATQHAPESIPAFSAIFSSGPDKDPKTWDDNVCSWR